jgi:trigger factor
LKIERAIKEFSAADVDKRLEGLLSRFGQLTPDEGVAEAGDYLTVNVKTSHDGKELASKKEQLLRIAPVLSFHDGRLEGFDKLVIGAKAGDTREAELQLTADAPNEALQGQKVKVSIKVQEVKKLKLPELTPEFLQEMGGFESEADLRDAIKDDLVRQLDYQRQQQARTQIIGALTESANWALPPGLLKRQSDRELQRAVLELRRAGFSEDEIHARENQLRQNSRASTDKALKEHFILERIAEDQEIDAEPGDYEAEIALIAAQSGQSIRRVRAQLDKQGLMDSLRNQIIERKTIDVVLAEAKFTDVPMEEDQEQTAAINLAAGGEEKDSKIPDVTETPKVAEAEENS